MKTVWQVTGSERRRNSQLAFSSVSNVACEMRRQGGESEPAGIRVTSIGELSISSTFSNTGWSLVYQKVIGRVILLGAAEGER